MQSTISADNEVQYMPAMRKPGADNCTYTRDRCSQESSFVTAHPKRGTWSRREAAAPCTQMLSRCSVEAFLEKILSLDLWQAFKLNADQLNFFSAF
jgi:hypothetical protein